jgi:hypothetical protein
MTCGRICTWDVGIQSYSHIPRSYRVKIGAVVRFGANVGDATSHVTISFASGLMAPNIVFVDYTRLLHIIPWILMQCFDNLIGKIHCYFHCCICGEA